MCPPVPRGCAGLEQGQVPWGSFQLSLSLGSPPVNPPAPAPGANTKRGGDAQRWLCVYPLQEMRGGLGTALLPGCPGQSSGNCWGKGTPWKLPPGWGSRGAALCTCVKLAISCWGGFSPLGTGSVFVLACHHLTPCVSLQLVFWSFRVVCVQESLSAQETSVSTYLVPAKQRVRLCTSHLLSHLFLRIPAACLKHFNAEGWALDWPWGTLALVGRWDVTPCQPAACPGIIWAGCSRAQASCLPADRRQCQHKRCCFSIRLDPRA